ncbi:hypothetical protein Ahy_B06g083926 [Arachis hypogaea]|uniref:Uncharacterized protein n=1 Tax=Arachis hypogaea TaxID=3818 RepID=A0A444YQN1_ARAHY|nr:hypothetical protein Ahy_B06g083926 [Arachis hypogaea]
MSPLPKSSGLPVAARNSGYDRATTARLSPVHHNRVLKPLTVLSLLRIGCFRVCAATIATVSKLCLLSLNGPGMQGSILETKSMDLVYTTLPMNTTMKEHGMRGAGKVSELTPFEMLTGDAVNGMLAARKMADSAINLRRVDDEVNKAVIAANRAAKAARVAAVKAVQNRMDGQFCDTDV